MLLLTGALRDELVKVEWNRIDLKTALLDVGKELLYTPDVGIYADVILRKKTVDNRRKNRINIRDQKKPLTALVKGFFFGANGENRTHDLFITSELLYP